MVRAHVHCAEGSRHAHSSFRCPVSVLPVHVAANGCPFKGGFMDPQISDGRLFLGRVS